MADNESSDISIAEFERMVAEPSAHAARVEFCELVSSAIDGCGRVLWAFGAAADLPEREGLALACQTAGELSTATVSLYREDRWYSGAALVRQFIECEYLVFLFAQDPSHATSWRQTTRKERLDFYTPSAMRKRSNGKFRSEEYAVHCERGGHPSPMGASLLAEHTTTLLGKNQYLWCDLAQHLERFWGSFAVAVKALKLDHIGIVQTALAEFPTWQASWKRKDDLSNGVSFTQTDANAGGRASQ